MTSVSDIEIEILQLINEHRATLDLAPLTFYLTIQEASFQHSNNMAHGSVPFGHTGFSERANQLVESLGGYAASENVAMGQRSAREVVQSWLNSEQHRKNIEGDFNLTGISVVKDKNGERLFTQLFIKAPQPNTAVTDEKEETVTSSNLNYYIFEQINQHRAQQYLPLFQINPHIQVIATQHAQDMAEGNIPFGHEGFEDRARLLLGKLSGSSVVENVALGNANAEQIVQTWLESSSHRNNIEGDFDWTGIGIAKSNEQQYYYCQIFIKK
ncbi:MAG: CAP domain-containing protein [Aureispira sp.]